MNLLLTILSYVFTGGLAAVVTAFVTLRAIKRKAVAEAISQEAEAEQKSIDTIERWRKAYGNIIGDLTERLDHALKRYSELEKKYEDQSGKYNELNRKYDVMERKYSELEKKYNNLKNPERPGAVRHNL